MNSCGEWAGVGRCTAIVPVPFFVPERRRSDDLEAGGSRII